MPSNCRPFPTGILAGDTFLVLLYQDAQIRAHHTLEGNRRCYWKDQQDVGFDWGKSHAGSSQQHPQGLGSRMGGH